MLLDKEYIQKNITIPVDIFSTIDSTNDYLKKFANPRICLAEEQTKGKGRLGRKWHSPYGQNIYLSCLYIFNKKLQDMQDLSLKVAAVITNVLQKFCPGEEFTIKYPNDVMWHDKKIAGILIELDKIDINNTRAIIGIGLNVNMIAADIDKSWISMRQILQQEIDRNLLAVTLINILLREINNI